MIFVKTIVGYHNNGPYSYVLTSYLNVGLSAS